MHPRLVGVLCSVSSSLKKQKDKQQGIRKKKANEKNSDIFA
jgi:hypothetical protein